MVLCMERFETQNFILEENIRDSHGDSTWLITQKKNGSIFLIHVFNTNHVNIKIFGNSKLSNPSEAISALCNHIIEKTGKIPYMNIHYTNKALITHCTKAGFRKVKNVKHLYTFKVKSTD